MKTLKSGAVGRRAARGSGSALARALLLDVALFAADLPPWMRTAFVRTVQEVATQGGHDAAFLLQVQTQADRQAQVRRRVGYELGA